MTILLADAGGTYIRFAVTHDGQRMSEPQKLRVADYPSLDDAITHFLFSQRLEMDKITALYFGCAGRNPWNRDDFGKTMPHIKLHVINDFEANASGVVTSTEADLHLLTDAEKHQVPSGASRAVIGSGTGLGLAYIVDTAHGSHVQRTHGAHMLPALTRNEHRDMLAALGQKFPQTRAPIYEDMLGGYGIYNMYKVLAERAHVSADYMDANDLIFRGRNDWVVQQTLKIYHEVLGIFAHQVLAFGYAYKGLYLTGGITDRLMGANLFDTVTFLENMRQPMVPVVSRDVAATPVYWLRDEFVSLRGLLFLAQQSAA